MYIQLLEYVHRNARIILPIHNLFAIAPTVRKDYLWLPTPRSPLLSWWRCQKQYIQARLSIIIVTLRKTCLAVILCPGPLKYLFYYLINLGFDLGVRHYPALSYISPLLLL